MDSREENFPGVSARSNDTLHMRFPFCLVRVRNAWKLLPTHPLSRKDITRSRYQAVS